MDADAHVDVDSGGIPNLPGGWGHTAEGQNLNGRVAMKPASIISLHHQMASHHQLMIKGQCWQLSMSLYKARVRVCACFTHG